VERGTKQLRFVPIPKKVETTPLVSHTEIYAHDSYIGTFHPLYLTVPAPFVAFCTSFRVIGQ